MSGSSVASSTRPGAAVGSDSIRLLARLLPLLLLAASCGGRSALFGASTDAATQFDRGSSDRFRSLESPFADRERPPADAALPPCARDIAELLVSLSPKMAVCRAPALWVDQCSAGKLCGPGWHLCGAAEYQDRFGASAAPTETTWIGACVRSGGEPHAPTNQACAQCPTQVVNLPGLIGWLCFGPAAGSLVQRLYVGVTSHPLCYRIGVDSPKTAAYWAPSAPDYKLRQAFCCRN